MTTSTDIDMQRQLVTALARSSLHSGGSAPAELIETHISWVLLMGDYAYKFKKGLNLGFLDYSTLDRRHHFCLEELRLNRRTAPRIYLDVVAITGTAEHPVLEGQGDAIEWAVKMLRFDQSALASHLIQYNELTPPDIDRLAFNIARFHRQIETAGAMTPFGTPENVWQPIDENFKQIEKLLDHSASASLTARLSEWYAQEIKRLTPCLMQRKQEGFIRECHGDLHLGNIVIIDNEPIPFDGIEFNDNLRYVDVISEIAFLLMDLDHRQRSDLGWRFLDGYLQENGDFPGLVLLRFYQVYRAMVRAKVDAIRACQKDIAEADRQTQFTEAESYLKLALSYTRRASPQLILTHGFSGSGKSRAAQRLLEQWGAVRLRSDVERKRLFRLGPTAQSGSNVNEGIYTADASARTYARLADLAALLLASGFNVIVDATFLRRADREQFVRLAQSHRVRWHLLDVTAPEAILRERIVARNIGHRDASEADIAVLEHQLRNHDPLTPDEQTHCIPVNSGETWTVDQIISRLV